MNKGRIDVIFFGNNDSILNYLIENTNVKSIFCVDDDTNNLAISEIKETAKRYLLPVNQPNVKDLDSYSQYICYLKPDLIIICGYKYIIPSEIFNIPKFGTINIHPSFLPYYRGQHVINWAIIHGEKETGVTIHFIDEGIDTGDIVIQEKISILFEDTAKILHDRIYKTACGLLQIVLNSILSGNSIPAKKQDNSKASYFRSRNPIDGLINWDKTGEEIYNLIRALVKPWPGAYSSINGKKIIFFDVKFEKDSLNSVVGEIISVTGKKFVINVKGGKLLVDAYTIFDKNENVIDLEVKIGDKFKNRCD